MNYQKRLGIFRNREEMEKVEESLRAFIRLKLKALGLPPVSERGESERQILEISEPLIDHFQEQLRMLKGAQCPVDNRIQSFLDAYFDEQGVAEKITLPESTFILDQHGVARVLSLPANGDHFESDIMDSYRIRQGVLHNPHKDRRTTTGVFHIAEGGLMIPDDKKAVPALTAARLLQAAFNPPASLMELPYHQGEANPARSWVSLLLRPTVCPEVEGFINRKSMEIRFFVPGNLVCNLDFVESIFGNGGDPYLSENDAGLDVLHWTGHTGCVVLAPQMLTLKKKDLGLPHVKDATERQKRDGMCWENEDELYNDGSAFKITVRDERGFIVTAIADNYFGYCKKEVKTQISFSANLYGLCEEEHAGGTLVFPAYDLGEDFRLTSYPVDEGYTIDRVVEEFSDIMDVQPEGHAIDKQFPDVVYVPENVYFRLEDQTASWERDGKTQQIYLDPGSIYVLPGGYRVNMVRPHGNRRWRLQGTSAEASFCHKPCTVSGGGKSEISKPLTDAIITGPNYIHDFQSDFEQLDQILSYDFSKRFRKPEDRKSDSRPILSNKRSLGSVIKLLTPSKTDYSDEYNAWLEAIPEHVRNLVFIIKRYYKDDWEENWKDRFSVDMINGQPGKELRYRKTKAITHYLRVGYLDDGSWRIFQLRKDFMPAEKLSMEDDITASVVTPTETIPGIRDKMGFASLKYAQNCEFRFFQRPDDAVIRGYDKQAERDLSSPGSFLSNYEPLPREEAYAQVRDAIRFSQYTEPMQEMIREVADGIGPGYFCSSANPRIVDGKPTKNPRYLQLRPDIVDERGRYLAKICTHLHYRVPLDRKAQLPITAVLPGRRNNPPEPNSNPPIRPLCVYNPIHYMDLPELLMEFIASITGKSPSTTGAGSEGALTKAPFNALLPIHDLNNAVVSYILTGADAFLSSAGHVGPKYRVDHDISLLIPEIWSRMHVEEQKADFLIENGFLDKCEDFEHNGKLVRASRLGYRINSAFMRIFGGRVFTNPASVFPEDMLKPELQDLEVFVDGVDNIVSAHQWVAEYYFRDGGIDLACPPLKAILHIMAYGDYEGKSIQDPEIRDLFSHDAMIESDWYKERLKNRQAVEVKLWTRHLEYLKAFMRQESYKSVAESMGCQERLKEAQRTLRIVESPFRLNDLVGTIGTDMFRHP